VTIKNNSSAFISALKRQCPKALEEIGQKAVRYAQQEIQQAGRVKTGAMYRSITFQVREDGVYVGTNNRHAAFHELGTGHFTRAHSGAPYGIKAVHFLHHAASRHTSEYRKIIKKALKG
jgi:phage gpG-like protein